MTRWANLEMWADPSDPEEPIREAEDTHTRMVEQARDPRVSLSKTPPARTPVPKPTMADVLAFEEKAHRHAGAKEEAIRATFNLGAARYYQILHGYIRTREALELNPMLVNRLRHQLEARMTARASRTFRPTENRKPS